MYGSSIYFRCAEDISIEFVPNHLEANNGNTVTQFDLKTAIGQPIGVWNFTNGNELPMREPMREQLHSGLITQSARGHNQTLSGT
eukprot:6491009-Amphidinium_carterae.2